MSDPELLERLRGERLTSEIEALVAALRQGPDMASSAYDTAWAARLAPGYPGRGFERAAEWLRKNQFEDGSFGAETLHFHDRTICTLAAITALARLRSESDHERIRRGQAFLFHALGRRGQDRHDTIAFPALVVALTKEARALGLEVPAEPSGPVVEAKLRALGNDPRSFRATPMLYSLEAIEERLGDRADLELLCSKSGAIGVSPAASAALLLRSPGLERCRTFLERTLEQQGDGGLPDVSPIDVFETSWIMRWLFQANAITPEHPAVQKAADFLSACWDPARGVSFSSEFPIPELDDSSVTSEVLRWAGRPVSLDFIAPYELEDRFRMQPAEVDPSVSTHIHLLGALEGASDSRAEAWRTKALTFLRKHATSSVWFDKWHVSPYYTTGEWVGVAANGGLHDGAKGAVHWIARTQREDGGFGFFGGSTPEETAYALRALLAWQRGPGDVAPERLRAAALYLARGFSDTEYTPLWIGKCLYTPVRVVRAAVVAALFEYFEQVP